MADIKLQYLLQSTPHIRENFAAHNTPDGLIPYSTQSAISLVTFVCDPPGSIEDLAL
jgi:hypothetical protein